MGLNMINIPIFLIIGELDKENYSGYLIFGIVTIYMEQNYTPFAYRYLVLSRATVAGLNHTQMTDVFSSVIIKIKRYMGYVTIMYTLLLKQE